MKSPSLNKRHGLFFLLFLLSACTGVSVKEPGFENIRAYQTRADKLGAISVWGLVGRISLDDGDQGGSGRLQWDVEPDNSELDFHGAMGRGAWHLQIGPGSAVLKEANGDEQRSTGVNALIQDRIGWPVPVDALHWWVRGLAAPGIIEDQEIDSAGQLTRLHQFGWIVDFNRFASYDGIALPVRLNATRDNYRVKLAISQWQMHVSNGSAN